jgi:uncharacterized protein with HEPN domain
MTRHEDAVRLRHLLDASRKARAFTRGRVRADLDRDEMLGLAVVRLLEIIGEAARAVSDDFKEEHPEIPWKAIVGARNRMIHRYFDVDLDIVWEIVETDLPDVVSKVEALLDEIGLP